MRSFVLLLAILFLSSWRVRCSSSRALSFLLFHAALGD